MTRRAQQKTLKEYLIPVWGLILILIVILRIFSWDSTPKAEKEISSIEETSQNIITFSTNDWAEAFLVNWDDKTKIEGNSLSYWDNIMVSKWFIAFGDLWINLNSDSNLKINSSENYSVYSGEIFSSSDSKTFEMKYMTVISNPEAKIWLKENDMKSEVSIFSGWAVVKLSNWDSYNLKKWDKLALTKADIDSENLSIEEKIEVIPEYLRNYKWYTINEAYSYLDSEEKTSEIKENSAEVISPSFVNFVTFNIEDEQTTKESKVDLTWEILSSNVESIDINWQKAKFNDEKTTFEFTDVEIEKWENNFVYRVFDSSSNILEKWVLTIYGESEAKNTIFSDDIKVKNYTNLEWFSFDLSNPYVTEKTWIVTISGKVPDWMVDKVVVNNFTLRKFKSWDTSWKYHAESRFDLLKDWLNLYNVEYFDKEWNLINKDLFIIKMENEKKEAN